MSNFCDQRRFSCVVFVVVNRAQTVKNKPLELIKFVWPTRDRYFLLLFFLSFIILFGYLNQDKKSKIPQRE